MSDGYRLFVTSCGTFNLYWKNGGERNQNTLDFQPFSSFNFSFPILPSFAIFSTHLIQSGPLIIPSLSIKVMLTSTTLYFDQSISHRGQQSAGHTNMRTFLVMYADRHLLSHFTRDISHTHGPHTHMRQIKSDWLISFNVSSSIWPCVKWGPLPSMLLLRKP